MTDLEKLFKEHNKLMRQLIKKLDQSIELAEETVTTLETIADTLNGRGQ